MGKRGPKPTPTKILAMRGSWRAKTREGEPVAPPAKPACPKGLSPRARACWKWLTDQLGAMGLLSTAESKSIERYCVIYDLHQDALAAIKKRGQMVELLDGEGHVQQVVKNPMLIERARYSKELLQIEREFGLTPSARTGMKVPAPASPDSDRGADDTDRFFRKA